MASASLRRRKIINSNVTPLFILALMAFADGIAHLSPRRYEGSG